LKMSRKQASFMLATLAAQWDVVCGNSTSFAVSSSLPSSAGVPVLEAFVSYSIEFAFFPDFAGERS